MKNRGMLTEGSGNVFKRHVTTKVTEWERGHQQNLQPAGLAVLTALPLLEYASSSGGVHNVACVHGHA